MNIDLTNISKSFDDSGNRRRIFNNVTARFPSGGIAVIVGKSGVGKSSLLNLISGIDLPDSGIIRAGDIEISRLSDTRRTLFRRRHIGFIYQFFNLVPVLTVLENVILVAELDGVPRDAARKRAAGLLERVGLADRAHEFPDRLSGGEQQRVAVVRALVNDPAILLADEPTGNLDQENGKIILDMIAGLARKHRKTLVMVTHSPEAEAYADQVFTVTDQALVAAARNAHA